MDLQSLGRDLWTYSPRAGIIKSDQGGNCSPKTIPASARGPRAPNPLPKSRSFEIAHTCVANSLFSARLDIGDKIWKHKIVTLLKLVHNVEADEMNRPAARTNSDGFFPGVPEETDTFIPT